MEGERKPMKLSVVVADANAPASAFVVWRGFDQSIPKTAEMGFDGIELALGEAADINVPQLDELLSKYGLSVSCISTGLTYARMGLYMTHPDPAKRDEIVRVFHGLVDLASTHGGFINMGRSRGFVAEGQTREEAEKLFLDTMGRVLPYAKEKGVTILIEPINRYESNFINTLDEATELLDRLHADNVGIMADVFHMNIEDDSIAGSLIRNSKYVKYVHIADSNRLAPGMGHTDFKAIMDALRSTGYDGWLSTEVLPGGDPDEIARRASAYMKPLMQA